jgi:cell division protein FtsB
MRIHGARYQSVVQIFFSRAKLMLIIGLVLLALIAVPLARKINQKRALDQEIQALSDEAVRLEQKNSDLQEVMNYLGSDGFAEKEGRLNLDLKKPGEQVVVIKGMESGATTTDAQTTSVFNVPGLDKEAAPPYISNVARWQNYFFGVR